jgi:phosphinothricin acetyltransferase
MRIEDATEADAEAIAAIYNHVIATSTAVFSDQPITADDRREWLRARGRQGFPVIVARDGAGGAAVAFASFADFRPWPGYRLTVEHSVHVADGHRRQGIGRRLVRELIVRAREAGKHVIVAGLDADNLASRGLHEQLGFREVARMPEVARKFDRWIDLVLLELILDGP